MRKRLPQTTYWDNHGNCAICGECGRCPGHSQQEFDDWLATHDITIPRYDGTNGPEVLRAIASALATMARKRAPHLGAQDPDLLATARDLNSLADSWSNTNG